MFHSRLELLEAIRTKIGQRGVELGTRTVRNCQQRDVSFDSHKVRETSRNLLGATGAYIEEGRIVNVLLCNNSAVKTNHVQI
jgi:hypothetical protein